MQCYRGNETQPHYPNTLQLLIELIRKIEDANPILGDIRTLSALLLHQLRIDGIERLPGAHESNYVTPFGASGIQTAKFQVILRMVSNVATNLDIFRVLNQAEVCQLHRMISSTVEPWSRGDEHKICSIIKDKKRKYSPELHRTHFVKPVEYVLIIN